MRVATPLGLTTLQTFVPRVAAAAATLGCGLSPVGAETLIATVGHVLTRLRLKTVAQLWVTETLVPVTLMHAIPVDVCEAEMVEIDKLRC